MFYLLTLPAVPRPSPYAMRTAHLVCMSFLRYCWIPAHLYCWDILRLPTHSHTCLSHTTFGSVLPATFYCTAHAFHLLLSYTTLPTRFSAHRSLPTICSNSIPTHTSLPHLPAPPSLPTTRFYHSATCHHHTHLPLHTPVHSLVPTFLFHLLPACRFHHTLPYHTACQTCLLTPTNSPDYRLLRCTALHCTTHLQLQCLLHTTHTHLPPYTTPTVLHTAYPFYLHTHTCLHTPTLHTFLCLPATILYLWFCFYCLHTISPLPPATAVPATFACSFTTSPVAFIFSVGTSAWVTAHHLPAHRSLHSCRSSHTCRTRILHSTTW